MLSKRCVFHKCNSDSRDPLNVCHCIKFVPFAKPSTDNEKCLRWIDASRRKDLSIDNINRYSYVCSKHFVGGRGPTRQNPDPLPASETNIEPVERPIFVKTERLDSDHEDEDSSKNEWMRDTSDEIEYKEESIELPEDNVEFPVIPKTEEVSLPDDDKGTVSGAWSEEQIGYSEKKHLLISTQNAECQTDKIPDIIVEKLEKEIILLRRKVGSGYLRLESCKHSGNKFKFYTGLTFEEFGVLWQFLGMPTALSIQFSLSKTKVDSTSVRDRNHNLNLQNQLFLTLVRLRRGFLIKDLSYRFGLSTSQIRVITTTWIQLMYTQFKKLDIFPTAEATKKTGLPKVFRKLKNLRIFIDIFEISINKSNDNKQQGKRHSTYRYRDTGKFLIGIDPSGDCCFLSDCFKGRFSDKDIVEKSGLFDMLHKQDLILTERDFNIKDLCKKNGCSVIRSKLLKRRDRQTNQRVGQTRDIDATRFCVKKFIRRIKEFRILRRSIPRTMLPLLTEIVFVIAMLVNFQPVIE